MLSRRCAGPVPGKKAARQRAAFDVFANRTVRIDPPGTRLVRQSAIAFRALAA